MERETNPVDVSQQFGQQMKKAYRWALLFLVSLVGMGVSAVGVLYLKSHGGNQNIITPFFVVCLLSLFSTIKPLLSAVRCPHCKRHLTGGIANFCPCCAARLRRDPTETEEKRRKNLFREG